jgi:ferritin-like metal-binding protein YciE
MGKGISPSSRQQHRALIVEGRKDVFMPAKIPVDLFARLLSSIRLHEERVTAVYRELGEYAQDPEIKETLNSMAFLSDKTLATIDKCFNLIGQKPVSIDERLLDLFVADFRKELNEIDSPVARALFVAGKAKNLLHLRVGEYQACIAMSELAGHPGVGFLLESCLSQKIAFFERNRQSVRRIVERELNR